MSRKKEEIKDWEKDIKAYQGDIKSCQDSILEEIDNIVRFEKRIDEIQQIIKNLKEGKQ